MFYPHADDENVAMGYANYNHTDVSTMVTIDEKAFRTYSLSKIKMVKLVEYKTDEMIIRERNENKL